MVPFFVVVLINVVAVVYAGYISLLICHMLFIILADCFCPRFLNNRREFNLTKLR